MAIIVGLWVNISLKSFIITPLLRLTREAEVVAKGDITSTLNMSSKGEVGYLTEVFFHLVSNLREIIRNLASTGTELVKTSQLLSEGSVETRSTSLAVSAALDEVDHGTTKQTRNLDEISNMIKQFSVAVEQIAIGAQEQGRIVSNTSEIVNKMAQSIHEVAYSAQNVFNVAEKTSEVARHGGRQLLMP